MPRDPDPPHDDYESAHGFGEPDPAPPEDDLGREPLDISRDDPNAPIPLGYDHGRFYYLSRADGQVHELTAHQHTQMPLMALASQAHYWERTRFQGKKGGVSWTEAADWLMQACREVGVYSPDRLRGRGAHWEGDHAVLHLGDRLVIDGAETPLRSHRSWHIYEAGARLDVDLSKPLGSSQATRLKELCDLLTLEESFMPVLLAGWIVIAPICGALPWRPHLWITGEKGSGKSYLFDYIIKPLVGRLALEVQSKTTEAYIRQKLGADARPVIFDEAEGEESRDRERIQAVLDLARQASSEKGAPIGKGSQSGRAMDFRIRSSFCFSSINLGVTRAADESRTVVISFAPLRTMPAEEAAERFAQIQDKVAQVMTPEFCGGLLARTLQLLPAIRANTETFARAWAERFGSRRQGDTIGSILAGEHSLRSRKVITPEEARAFLAKHSWVQRAAERTDTSADHERALLHLVQMLIRHHTGSGPLAETSVGELIATAVADTAKLADPRNDMTDHQKSVAAAIVDTLKRHGIKVEGDTVWLARSHAVLGTLFRDTPWAASWPNILLQTPGARRSAAVIRFGGSVSRGIGIPMEAITMPDT